MSESGAVLRPAYRIADLQESDRPRERLVQLGAEALSTAELLGILLRVGVPGENAVQLGVRLLHEFGGLPGLHRAPMEELTEQHGIGAAKAIQIKAAIELGRRVAVEVPEGLRIINSPEDAAALLRVKMSAFEDERLYVILLDTRNHVLGEPEELYHGSVNTSQVRIGEVFKPAVRRNATGIIIVHNHPSGDPTPSPDDLAITRACVEAGKLLDIDVLDHLVIGQGRYVSMKERGLGFS